MQAPLAWDRLKLLHRGDSTEELGFDISVLTASLYKIAETQYCVVKPSEDGAAPILLSLLWAPSDGAARRALLNEVEADNIATGCPPKELLPASLHSCVYREILAGLKQAKAAGVSESATYRIMTDGAFVHKSISSSMAVYFFRDTQIAPEEKPYAILWKLRPLS